MQSVFPALPDPAVSPAGAFPWWPDSGGGRPARQRARAGRDGEPAPMGRRADWDGGGWVTAPRIRRAPATMRTDEDLDREHPAQPRGPRQPAPTPVPLRCPPCVTRGRRRHDRRGPSGMRGEQANGRRPAAGAAGARGPLSARATPTAPRAARSSRRATGAGARPRVARPRGVRGAARLRNRWRLMSGARRGSCFLG